MDTEKVVSDLNKRFAQQLPPYYKRRVVFWLDEEREYADKLDDFELENAKLIQLTGSNLFTVKKLLGHDDPYGNYVVYCPVAYEKLEDNWLLDIQLYSGEPYRTDLISQWMSEMHLFDSQDIRRLVKHYRKFFNAQARRAKVAAMPTINTQPQLHLAVMSAIAGVKQPQPNSIIKAVLEAGLDLETNDVYQSLVDYDAKDAFWQLAAKASGYNEENISLRRLAAHILLTASTRTMKPENLGGLERFISLPHQARCYDLISEWLHSDDKQSLYEIARQVENEFMLPRRFEKLQINDLLETECFPCVNESILARIMQYISNEIIEVKTIVETVQKRRTCVWYEAVEIYYEGLLQVANMQSFYLDHAAGFHEAQPEAIWKAYTDDYYRMDTFYRLFHVAYGESLKGYKESLSDLFAHVADQVEKLYVNWFMKELSENWTNVSEDDLKDLGYVRGIPRQVDFYKNRVVVRKSPTTGRPERSKTFVVISDALRYEVASGLADVLKREQQAKVSLSSMQGIFPTITKFGMAALLPHKELSISTENGIVKVLADGVSTDSNYRDKILKVANPKSLAVRYEEIISLKQKEVRDLIAGMEVVYIYHDRVDASSHGNEADVFSACDTAIRELHGLVKKITGDMNGTHILITADHGFLYTHDPLTESDKVSKASFQEESIEYGRRYAILKEGAEPDYLMSIRMETEGIAAFAPRESIRIKMQGAGLNFVHGGASLQEMVVPVISYQHLRNDSKEYQRNKAKYDTKPVTISLLSASHQISNMIFSLEFYQKEAVSANWSAETYQLYFADAAGHPISDTQKLIADKTDEDNRARTWRVTFNLKQQKYDQHTPYYLVIQDERGLQLPQREEFHIMIAMAIDEFNFFD
ncbi:MAG: BREX-1 system phosphatase PglZ type A [Clostridia bacterium]|nr:BREX-1 system phosphatase PglZ type A [Clostridia bacterium]